jgi:hypothetical protein
MILNNKAVKKESTPKPPTIVSHSNIMIALITSKKSPRVIKVTGKVSITKIGLIKILSRPNTTATISAVVNPATCTPVMKFAINKTRADVTRILINNFIDF